MSKTYTVNVRAYICASIFTCLLTLYYLFSSILRRQGSVRLHRCRLITSYSAAAATTVAAKMRLTILYACEAAFIAVGTGRSYTTRLRVFAAGFSVIHGRLSHHNTYPSPSPFTGCWRRCVCPTDRSSLRQHKSSTVRTPRRPDRTLSS